MKHKDLIDQLTLEEKAALLGGKGEWDSRDIPRFQRIRKSIPIFFVPLNLLLSQLPKK